MATGPRSTSCIAMMLEAFRERNFSDPAKIRVVATR
jgi:hypothetical protein